MFSPSLELTVKIVNMAKSGALVYDDAVALATEVAVIGGFEHPPNPINPCGTRT
jgi:hypothetical protein